MAGRWKWFLRVGEVSVDLTGQVVSGGDVPGCWRRATAEGRVPDGAVTSRCDDAVVFVVPAQRGSRPASRSTVRPAGRDGNQRRWFRPAPSPARRRPQLGGQGR